jgi:hypothetical protein
VHLSWIRPATASSCPDAGDIQADVVQRLGRHPFTEPSRRRCGGPLQHRNDLVEHAPAAYATVFTDLLVSGFFYLGVGVQY